MTVYFGANHDLFIRDYGGEKLQIGVQGLDAEFAQTITFSEPDIEELVRYLSGWLRASDKEN